MIILAKKISLFNTPIIDKPKEEKEVRKQRKESKKKSVEANVPKPLPKPLPKQINTSTKSINTQTNTPTKSDNTPTERWHKTNTNPPVEFRPIEFNTDCKKPVRGFKTHGGYITNTPYYLNKTFKLNGYLEWKYIPVCMTLTKCPNGFPDCEHCDRK